MNKGTRGNRSLDLLKKEKNMTFYFCGGSNGIRKRDEDIEATRALKRYKIYK